jgi:uncharacterized protein
MPQNRDSHHLLDGPAGAIEAVLKRPDEFRADCAAVVCHPHPLYGGSMDNKVVTTLVRAFQELGLACLKFNFRGVGRSEGVHDEGVGEVDDLVAAVDWLRAELGVDKVVLAGFSFGSGVVSNGCLRIPGVVHSVFVAPPVGRYNFAAAASYPCPITLLMGDQDELVDPAQAFAWAGALGSPVEVIALAQASHFFHGQLVPLREKLVASLTHQLNLT